MSKVTKQHGINTDIQKCQHSKIKLIDVRWGVEPVIPESQVPMGDGFIRQAQCERCKEWVHSDYFYQTLVRA